ncbi:hypothetical protein BJV77DRAFT_135658 [Russula vinacea]|nr:hypothetical protein BJV77DRAFT_135658 [Russula vinacea]
MGLKCSHPPNPFTHITPFRGGVIALASCYEESPSGPTSWTTPPYCACDRTKKTTKRPFPLSPTCQQTYAVREEGNRPHPPAPVPADTYSSPYATPCPGLMESVW